MDSKDFDATMLELGLQDDGFCERIDEDLDYSFALMLQSLDDDDDEVKGNKEKLKSHLQEDTKKSLSIVDQQWEILDPSPDIHMLFQQFNTEFFWGVLESVEVRWSPRMTLCAGICCYEGRGGLCSVRLSQPLLKYRPRRDLVETLLHEMIHAYLFVTNNNKDHDGHGPEFLKHMNRINSQTGTRISVYHSFHDEVDYQRQHWWKCNGPCQRQRPYFGIVKRAMNRAPSSRDFWWSSHQAQCGGSFTKIKEPENFGKKKAAKQKALFGISGSKSATKDIKEFLTVTPSKDKGSTSAAFLNSENLKKTITSDISNSAPIQQTYGKSNLQEKESSNIRTVSSSVKKNNGFTPFSGNGYVLGTALSGKADQTYLMTSNKSKPKLGNYSTHTHQVSALGNLNDFKSRNVTSAPRKFHGASTNNGGYKVSRPSGSSGITSTVARGGSRTIVLNKKSKPKSTKHHDDALKPVAYIGAGHVLGKSSTPGNSKHEVTKDDSPSKLVRQKSLDNFFPKMPSKQCKRSIIFSSDSDDEILRKTQRSKSPGASCRGSSLFNTNLHIDVESSSSNNDLEKTVHCPVCGTCVNSLQINCHLDSCLEKT